MVLRPLRVIVMIGVEGDMIAWIVRKMLDLMIQWNC